MYLNRKQEQLHPDCHDTRVSNIHSCVVNNGLSFDLTVSRLVTASRLEDHWLCIKLNQLNGRLTSVIFVNENENENAKIAKLVTQRKC